MKHHDRTVYGRFTIHEWKRLSYAKQLRVRDEYLAEQQRQQSIAANAPNSY